MERCSLEATFNKDISAWNVKSVTNMSDMFDNAQNFKQNIGNWDVSSVTNMGNMFKNAHSFNQSLNSWDVSSVQSMVKCSDGYMLDGDMFGGMSNVTYRWNV